MQLQRAELACTLRTPVFLDPGNHEVVIDAVSSSGFMAKVTGPLHWQEWVPISMLREEVAPVLHWPR